MAQNSGGVSLPAITMGLGGLYLLWCAIQDPVGGPVGGLRDMLQGRLPRPGVQTEGTKGKDLLPGTTANVEQARRNILAIAAKYLGAPYKFGGSHADGMDCSGLVMVAYEYGAGIRLPHSSSGQAARGRRIDKAAARAADLVAWGAPGNYSHVGLVVDGSTCIMARTWGTVVSYQPIEQKMVPGYGLPDYFRILPTE